MARQVPDGYFAFIGTALAALSFKNGIISRNTVSNAPVGSEVAGWLSWVVLAVFDVCNPNTTTLKGTSIKKDSARRVPDGADEVT